jgi:hypothetical protein
LKNQTKNKTIENKKTSQKSDKNKTKTNTNKQKIKLILYVCVFVFRNNNITFTLDWDITPITGRLQRHTAHSISFTMPSEHLFKETYFNNN